MKRQRDKTINNVIKIKIKVFMVIFFKVMQKYKLKRDLQKCKTINLGGWKYIDFCEKE